MRKNSFNLIACAMVFVSCLVISNVIASKVVVTGLSLFGNPVMVPSAVLCYALTFLATDVVGEIWGKREAQQLVRIGFFCQVIVLGLIVMAQFLPAADPAMQQAYEMLLGQNFVFVAASLTAYLCSQSWDVFVFHRIRDWARGRDESGFERKRWLWNNASTMTSQMIDTIIYIGIAFGIGSGWLFQGEMVGTLVAMMVGQYLVKFIISLLDTPFFYLLTHRAVHEAREAE